MTDDDVLDAMMRYGGSFIRQLAWAYRCADAENQARLKGAFLDVWQTYGARAQQDAQRRVGVN